LSGEAFIGVYDIKKGGLLSVAFLQELCVLAQLGVYFWFVFEYHLTMSQFGGGSIHDSYRYHLGLVSKSYSIF